MIIYEFTVRNNHGMPFPLDMLRYGSCWPIDSVSVANMACSHQALAEAKSSGFKPVYTVKLHALAGPCAERWATMNWAIVGTVSKRTV